nr:PREDICTED: bicaudal D-related protein 2 isoform X1 [Lepisosteus oculatus]XP_015192828.1 PREDICTED: bicaudal D-related protein 2 isoform X1 [Lepisosteus oculatus]XP_015192830.1 PREDICTED: bicaudal D-related protein 2 isoform X1 [Lepisosteus oculatus]XP_015192831.1 PREDICTED: bicaudal D-related protein 2 isoform X1 [Lepisosteus oculatus]
MSDVVWRGSDPARASREQVLSRRDRLPPPLLEEGFFPFSSQPRESLLVPGLPGLASRLDAASQEDSSPHLLERDLILAAEVGQALLERNEQLGAQLEEKEREIEGLQQKRHELQRQLEASGLEWAQRVAELEADLGALRAELEQQQSQDRERRREGSQELGQLSSHNQKLVEQLAEAVMVEHSLRSELRSLREEYEEKTLSSSVSTARVENLQKENRVLQERAALGERRLAALQEDHVRLCAESAGLRDRVLELQERDRERERELAQERSEAFELQTLNHSLQSRVQALGEKISLAEPASLARSLKSEIEQTQAQDSSFVPVENLREREEEIHQLKEELESKARELESLRKEVKQLSEQPSYSALEEDLNRVREERDSLNQQLLNTIRHKVALSQELEAWQEDMSLLISQQVRSQSQGEEERAREKRASIRRNARTSRSFRLPARRGEEEERGTGSFFSSLFNKS